MPLQAMFAAVATIDEYLPNRHALIGGLAVMIRVADAHRATGDIDEVAFGTEPEPAQILVDAGVAVSTSTRSTVEAGGVKIDIIAVDDYDLYRLLQSDLAAGRSVVSTLATAPADLGEWTLAQLRERFVDDGPSTVRMISNLALAGPVTVDDLAGVYAAVTANR